MITLILNCLLGGNFYIIIIIIILFFKLASPSVAWGAGPDEGERRVQENDGLGEPASARQDLENHYEVFQDILKRVSASPSLIGEDDAVRPACSFMKDTLLSVLGYLLFFEIESIREISAITNPESFLEETEEQRFKAWKLFDAFEKKERPSLLRKASLQMERVWSSHGVVLNNIADDKIKSAMDARAPYASEELVSYLQRIEGD